MRVLGALVSAAFAVQACRLFAEPKVDDFWEFCHWIGQACLGIFVGLGGCYAEFRGSMKSVIRHCGKFMLNRIGLSIFYFWLGCYIMGGTLIGTGVWKTLAHVTGITSWFVAASDLLISCCSEKGDDDDDEEEGLSSARKDVDSGKTAAISTVGRPSHLADPGTNGKAIAGTSSAVGNGRVETKDVELFQSNSGDRGSGNALPDPEGGWATSGGSRGFGSS